MARCIVILTLLVPIFGFAISNERTAAGKMSQKLLSFLGKRVFFAIACTVAPPDLTRGIAARQRVKHGEHRGRPYAGAQQDDGVVAPGQGEAAPGCAHRKHVAGLDAVVKEVASCSFGTLHAYAISPPSLRA